MNNLKFMRFIISLVDFLDSDFTILRINDNVIQMFFYLLLNWNICSYDSDIIFYLISS